MSGYLHNLARRAVRRTAVLHSVATLPFAAELSMLPQQEESHVDLRPLARSPDSDGAAKQVTRSTVNRAAQEEGARARRAPERPPRTRAPEPLLPRAIEATVRASQPLARARPPAATADTAPRSAAAAASESDRTTFAGKPHEFAHEGLSRWPETTVLHTASAAQVTVVPSRRVTPATAAQGSRPAGAVETPTEVHLSIGRVEVAVLAQPPGPKEARPRVNRTMSLAEYERRRRERDR